MKKNKNPLPLRMSRRQVQRKFPPGSLVFNRHSPLELVVGWYPVPRAKDYRGPFTAASWNVLLIRDDQRLVHQCWEYLLGAWTLEEYEERP